MHVPVSASHVHVLVGEIIRKRFAGPKSMLILALRMLCQGTPVYIPADHVCMYRSHSQCPLAVLLLPRTAAAWLLQQGLASPSGHITELEGVGDPRSFFL